MGAVFSPGNQKIMFVLAAMLALVCVFVGSNVAANHEPKPHGLPLGVVRRRREFHRWDWQERPRSGPRHALVG